MTSEITVTGGTNSFEGATGSGIQTDVRILPALLIDKIAKPKSTVSLRFKSKASATNKKLSYTVSNARKATCSITGKSGASNVTLVKSVKSTSKGVISTSLTTSTLRSKLKLSAGKTASLTITCVVGKSKVVRRVSQVLK